MHQAPPMYFKSENNNVCLSLVLTAAASPLTHACTPTHTAIVSEAKSSSGLVGELDKELQEGLKERLKSDSDFNPQQFPAAEKVFQPGK